MLGVEGVRVLALNFTAQGVAEADKWTQVLARY